MRKIWEAKDPEKYKALTRRYILKKFGLTFELYAEMEKKQKGRCAICGGRPGKRRLHIDHDHKTKKVRGLLCTRCNVGLGMFRDNIKLMEKGAKYLC